MGQWAGEQPNKELDGWPGALAGGRPGYPTRRRVGSTHCWRTQILPSTAVTPSAATGAAVSGSVATGAAVSGSVATGSVATGSATASPADPVQPTQVRAAPGATAKSPLGHTRTASAFSERPGITLTTLSYTRALCRACDHAGRAAADCHERGTKGHLIAHFRSCIFTSVTGHSFRMTSHKASDGRHI